MDPLMIAELILKVGVPFVAGLLEKIEKKEPVSLAEWNVLVTKIQVPFDSLVPEVNVAHTPAAP